MSLLPIRIYGDKVLRTPAQPVETVTPELATLAEDMLETMYDAPGIGLAAPQVGHSVRLMVVDVRESDEDPKKPLVLFNPTIHSQKGKYLDEEGCLSFPEIYAQVPRYETISVDFLDIEGKSVALKDVSGLLARCIQHEYDHLEGILFIDKLSATDKLMLKSKLKKLKKQQSAKT